MASRDVLKMLLCGPVTHLTKWKAIGEKNSSSGTIINDISELVPKPVTLYKLEDGVLLDVPAQEIVSLFEEDTSWSARYLTDNKCNNLLYTLDIRILDILCGLLKNNGLNKLLTKAKIVNTSKDISELNALSLFIVCLVMNYAFCNYSENTLDRLVMFVGQMDYVSKQIQDMQLVMNKKMTKKSAVMDATAKYFLNLGIFNFSEEFWESIAKLLITLGARINLDECKKDKWGIATKTTIITEYLIKMNDRFVFSSMYNIKNTFSFYIGTFLSDNNYTADYNSISFPAYKLSVSELANIVMSENLKAEIYLHGLSDSEVAALLSDITSFTALEMLKEGKVSDGETCVVFQQILNYGDN